MAPLAGIDQVAEALGEKQVNAAEAIAAICDQYLSKEIKSADAAQKIDEIIDETLD